MLDEVLKTSLRGKRQLSAIAFSDEKGLSDVRLVKNALDGDEAAFAEIFERYKFPVTRVVSRFFRDRGEIEEHVQQAFAKAYFSLRKFRGGEDNAFAAWLMRIAVNVCYDEFRRRKRRSEDILSDTTDAEYDYIETVADGRRPSAEDSLVAAQLVEKITAGMDPRDRVAMTLVYCEEYSLDEVALAMGITTGNLKSRLFRCRNFIKRRFRHFLE